METSETKNDDNNENIILRNVRRYSLCFNDDTMNDPKNDLGTLGILSDNNNNNDYKETKTNNDNTIETENSDTSVEIWESMPSPKLQNAEMLKKNAKGIVVDGRIHAPINDINEIINNICCLKMSFPNFGDRQGTAIILPAYKYSNEYKCNIQYGLTAAHNVIYVDRLFGTEYDADYIGLEIRNNIEKHQSNILHEFEVCKWTVYPKYRNDPTEYSGYDIALIEIKDKDNILKNMKHIPIKHYDCQATNIAKLIGYPGKYTDNMNSNWLFGMVGKYKIHESKRLIEYDSIDPSSGQSGAPIFGVSVNDNTVDNIYNNWDNTDIIGIHTGGDDLRNWGTYLNDDIIKWILDTIPNECKNIMFKSMGINDEKESKLDDINVDNYESKSDAESQKNIKQFWLCDHCDTMNHYNSIICHKCQLMSNQNINLHYISQAKDINHFDKTQNNAENQEIRGLDESDTDDDDDDTRTDRYYYTQFDKTPDISHHTWNKTLFNNIINHKIPILISGYIRQILCYNIGEQKNIITLCGYFYTVSRDLIQSCNIITSGGDNKQYYLINKKCCSLSGLLTTLQSKSNEVIQLPIKQVPADTLCDVIDYLVHHNGIEPPPLPCPVRSIHMKEIVSDIWDANFIDKFDKKKIFEIILACNYMDIKSLLHLGCAKIATLIKQLDQNEINRIIEEEEQYRREHAIQNNND